MFLYDPPQPPQRVLEVVLSLLSSLEITSGLLERLCSVLPSGLWFSRFSYRSGECRGRVHGDYFCRN